MLSGGAAAPLPVDDLERTLTVLGVTARVAGCATLLVVPPGLALGLLLARSRGRLAVVLDTLCQLPLVMPASAVGYLLLVALSRRGPLGFDPGVLFTWRAAVLASATMALPLVTRTAAVAFGEVDPRLERMAASLGCSRLRVLLTVTLPLARRGVLAAAVLGFARALGEFGATVVVAGNIAGETQTLALAIFEDIQLGRDERAATLLGVAALLAFLCILVVDRLLGRGRAR